MPNPPIQVYIVDDESSVAKAYARLVRSAKMQPRTFASVEDFMRAEFSDENACVVSDVQFPGKSGLELPVLLGRAGHHLPVIFVTGFPERLLTGKQVEPAFVISKPFDPDLLRAAIAQALDTVSI